MRNSYEKLTIRDKFMFGKVTQDPVIAQGLAGLLIPVPIGKVTEVEREKFIQHRSTSKYVKLDMYLEEENGNAEDDFTRQLDTAVKCARMNEEWRTEYMKTYVNDMDMRREGYEEGVAEGVSRGLSQGILQEKMHAIQRLLANGCTEEFCLSLGYTKEEIEGAKKSD